MNFRIALAFFGFALVGVSGGALGVLLPSIGNYYHVDQATIGFLFLASSVGYFFSALSSSMLLERLGLRLYLVLGALTVLVGTLSFSITPPFLIVIIMKFVMGFGFAFIETGFNTYCVTLPRHTAVLNSLHAFYGAGAFIGPFIAAGFLALHWSWNSVYIVLTVLILLLLPGIIFTFDSSTSYVQEQEGEKIATKQSFATMLKMPLVWLITLFLLFYVGIETSLGNWSYSFLVEGLHLQAFFASGIVSGYWLGLTLGRFVLARIAERFGRSNVTLIYICIVGALLGTLLVWLLPGGLVAAFSFCFIGFCLGPIYPTTVAVLPKLVPSHMVASAIGFLVSLSILGIALFPGLAGILAQDIGIWSLIPYAVALTLLTLLFWWLTFRRNVGEGKSEYVAEA